MTHRAPCLIRVALVTTVVDALRELKSIHREKSYRQIADEFVPNNEELVEVAEDLDRYRSDEVDAELERLWIAAEDALSTETTEEA